MSSISSPITTHVLDTARGKPAVGIPVRLHMHTGGEWQELGRGTTNQDGRITDLFTDGKLSAGKYRLTFETGNYLSSSGKPFFPEVSIVFDIHDTAEHYHVPLLLSPYGYSTYRGS
jgi:5-hydroxyisourate hydrolase